MANLIRKELDGAPNKDPPSKPFIAPELSSAPWIPDKSDHTSAMSSWKALSKNRKPDPPECSIQSFILFQLRFVFAADLCQAWHPFGFLAPQPSIVPIVRNLEITETAGVSLSYRQALMAELAEKARRRTNDAAAFTLLLPKTNSLRFANRRSAR